MASSIGSCVWRSKSAQSVCFASRGANLRRSAGIYSRSLRAPVFLVDRCREATVALGDRIRKWWTTPVYFLFVDGMKPIPLSPEVAEVIDRYLAEPEDQVPATLMLLWPNGDKVRFRVRSISALTTAGARWKFGPDPRPVIYKS
jgi:hypothetical protein